MILGISKSFPFEFEFVVDDFSDVKSLLSVHSQKWHFSAWHKINLLPYGDIFVLSFRNSPFSETWIKEPAGGEHPERPLHQGEGAG